MSMTMSRSVLNEQHDEVDVHDCNLCNALLSGHSLDFSLALNALNLGLGSLVLRDPASAEARVRKAT